MASAYSLLPSPALIFCVFLILILNNIESASWTGSWQRYQALQVRCMEFDSYKVGEWFNANTEAIINRSLQTGAAPNISDAYTINGLTGPLNNCSAKDTFKLKAKPGKTYLLRLINAALNGALLQHCIPLSYSS
ncbi:hypothetical protein LWI28_026266 [Acer negundo]|uniref:Plastocyanin-like domain-containing protein n=1 Tax=Acer negundo TaxID=4023 RepID=A0AAD5I8A2_ACENE|nr:hypothetical protein LWI28_026266 [Acer negundo]